jgi:putative addiction module component (TIGR02574 family)
VLWCSMRSEIDTSNLVELPEAKRLEIIEQLWDSLDIDAWPLPEWQIQELDQRIDALERGGVIGAPWDEVRRRIIEAS